MPFKDKEKQKEYNKAWREANKEKNKEYQKEYNEKNKEKIKESSKEWRKNNKEKIKEKDKERNKERREYNKEYNKVYKEKNKDTIKEYNKEWREKNKEYQKEYNQTEKGKKTHRISNWKTKGIKSDDFDSLYEYYLNVKNCELCEIELVEGNKSNSRCLDHNHDTGLFRNVLCNGCNVKRK
tara:strand:- start:50 stop:592 length:543 start_codon:yes stop_codon:yes gene_type:complete